jgi:hypothetical protein
MNWKDIVNAMGSGDGMWMQLVQYNIKWRALVLTVFILRVLLPERRLVETLNNSIQWAVREFITST